jgi:hypothetical protein
VPGSVDRDTSPTQRIVEAVPLIPAEGALTGWAAAYVCGVDVLDGLDRRTMRPQKVEIVRGADRGHIPREWVTSCRDRLPPDEVIMVHGIAVTAPIRAAFDGMRKATSLADAVAFADAMLASGLVGARALSAYARSRPGWRGVPRARRAAALADCRAASPWESILRVEYVERCDLPAPIVNQEVYDLNGNLLGILDLLDEEAGLGTEFDGQHHRERERHRADNVREERLEAAGLIVVRVDSADLMWHPDDVRDRLRAAWHRGMRRDRRLDRWTTTKPAS